MSEQLQWIPLDRKLSATTASTNFFKALKAERSKYNLETFNTGQGRERKPIRLLVDLAKQELLKSIEREDFVDAEYNTIMGEIRLSAATWVKEILNVEATQETTSVIQMQGRAMLDESFRLIAKLADFPKGGHVLIPDSSWPMVGDLLEDYNLTGVEYAMERGKYAENIRKQLEMPGNNIVAVYVNSPHNPTGQILTAQDFHDIFAVLNEYNTPEMVAKRGYKIGLVMDNPYPQACPETVRNGKRCLDTGFDAFTQNQETPWIMPISASKFFGTARPGFTMTVAHPYYAKHLESRLMRTGKAISYVGAFFNAVNILLSPASAGAVMDWFADLRNKYLPNFESLKKALGTKRVDGDAGMIGLGEFDPKDYIGQVMKKHDGSDFVINDANDLLEYIGNTQGVVAVNNGVNKKTGFWRIRFAAAELPEAFSNAMTAFTKGLNTVSPPRGQDPSQPAKPATPET